MSVSPPQMMVSCMVPTRNRCRFASQAIWYFLRQDYPQKELIALDDGDACVGNLIPNDERIRYVRLEHRLMVGAKRNLGCRMSRGGLIAHRGDDNRMSSERLSIQATQLMESDALACGARNLRLSSCQA
ncbi:MAG: glycosyltransferase family 2 protein [Blastocatellia bacterium]|nr:glycosyltransferase family 2 protein [Blastocatellia bacterium]